MIRHIVLFKLKPKITKQETEELIRQLSGLKEKIEQVRAIDVEIDVGRTENSYDLVLDTLFDNMDDVKTYSTHPAHVEVVEMAERLCESRIKIDYLTKNVCI